MKFSITISFDVPDGTTFQVQPEAQAVYTPAYQDELIPLPDAAIPLPGDVNVPPGFAEGARIAQPTPVFRGVATGQVPPELCPVHKVPWKTVPPGVSKSSGKAYAAFWGCSSQDKCRERPSIAFVSTHPISA